MAQEQTIAVEGMTCTGCEEAIQRALGRLDGVLRSSADHQAGRVEVRFDPARVSGDDLAERIRAAGYDVV